MKIIKTYQNGYVDIMAETERDSLYEKGDYIEVDYLNYYIFDYYIKDGRHVYQSHTV